MPETIDKDNFPGDPSDVADSKAPPAKKKKAGRPPPPDPDGVLIATKEVLCACGCGETFEADGRKKYLDDKHREKARTRRLREKRGGKGAREIPQDPTASGMTRLIPIRIKPLPEAEEAQMYLCAVLDGAPFHNRNFGGVGFNRKSHTIARDAEGRGKIHNRYPGQRHLLTSEQARYCLERVANSVIRWLNKNNGRGFVLSTDSDSYQQMPGDEPVAPYLVMIEAEKVSIAEGATLRVPTIADMWGDEVPEAEKNPEE